MSLLGKVENVAQDRSQSYRDGMSRIATSITMSMRELDRLKTIQRVVDRMLRVGQAAEGLGISCRRSSGW
jgi:hypothetical protein